MPPTPRRKRRVAVKKARPQRVPPRSAMAPQRLDTYYAAHVVDGRAELPRIQGIVCYTLFMLPSADARRREVYRRVLEARASLHTALEGQVLRSAEDIGRIEDIWLVQRALAHAPKSL